MFAEVKEVVVVKMEEVGRKREWRREGKEEEQEERVEWCFEAEKGEEEGEGKKLMRKGEEKKAIAAKRKKALIDYLGGWKRRTAERKKRMSKMNIAFRRD